MTKDFKLLLGAVLLCLGIGSLGGIFTFSAIPNWYEFLIKPDFTPPGYIFGPVWTALYIFMGSSLYLIWKSASKVKKTALSIFYFQLFLNFLWSAVFFGGRNINAALVVVFVLWISIALTIYYFGQIKKEAAWLLQPYLVWVTFAIYMNYGVIILN